MAANILPIRPVGVRACATTTGHRKPEMSSSKGGSSSSSSSGSGWWSPIFGWSIETDYLVVDATENSKKKTSLDLDPKASVRTRARFSPGAFTEEKARQLRMMTTETTAFHDAMYHSSIAAKLASDFSKRSSDC